MQPFAGPYLPGVSTLYLVSTPIGNLGDLSRRAAEVLGSVDRILAEDTRRTRVLLDHLELRTPLSSLHGHNEAARLEQVLARLEAGETLALVSDAGTPLLSDPGERLVSAALEAGHRVVPVPGPSAILAALVASGLPVVPFTFLGFVPRKGRERQAFLERVASSPETVVVFEAPGRLVALLEALAARCGPERRVAVARELTKLHEEVVRGTPEEVAAYYRESPPRGEVSLVVGPASTPPPAGAEVQAQARALASALLEEGMPPSRAAREVSASLGLRRSEAYRIVHSLPDPTGAPET